MREMFTVRRIVQGEGVERIFPLHSPQDRQDRGEAHRRASAGPSCTTCATASARRPACASASQGRARHGRRQGRQGEEPSRRDSRRREADDLTREHASTQASRVRTRACFACSLVGCDMAGESPPQALVAALVRHPLRARRRSLPAPPRLPHPRPQLHLSATANSTSSPSTAAASSSSRCARPAATTRNARPLSVDDAKQRRLTELALHFLQQHRLLNQPARFDVLAVSWPADQREPRDRPLSAMPSRRWGGFRCIREGAACRRCKGRYAVKSVDEQLALIRRGVEQIVPRGRAAQEARAQRQDRQAAARQVRHRPHRHRRPPRPHRPAAQAAAVPGTGPPGGPHHRQLHRPGRRPQRPRSDARPPDAGAGRGQRPRLPASRSARSSTSPRPRCTHNGDWFGKFTLPRRAGADQQDHRAADAGARRLHQALQGRAVGADLPARMPVPADAGARQRRDQGRRGTGRQRAAVQPDGRPRPADATPARSRRSA